jgi:hypothetical protein
MVTLLGGASAKIGDLTLHARDDAGVEWFLDDIDGWGVPKPTLQVVQRPGGHGGFSGSSFIGPRNLVVKGHTRTTPTNLSYAMDQLYSAFSEDPTVLEVNEQGRKRRCTVRRSDEIIPTWVGDTTCEWSAQVVADDPRMYGDPVTISTGLPSSTGGLTLPATFPIMFTGVTVSGLVRIDNPGNIAAPLMVRFDGDVTGPRIYHQQTGKLWAMAGFNIPAGQWVTVTMGPSRWEALAQGQATRAGYITSRGWMELVPGRNDFAFGADVYSPGALMTVTAAPAWK